MKSQKDSSLYLPQIIELNLKKYKVVLLHYDGLSYSEIEAKTGFKSGTISKLIKKFQTYGDVNFNCYKENGGRLQVLDDADKMIIEEALTQNNQETLKELQNLLVEENNKKVSFWTLNHFEHEVGRFKVPLQKPILSEKNRQKRLEYSLFHRDDFFSNVIFTDESYFSLNRNTKKVFIFYGEEELKFSPWHNPDEAVMIWGAICRRGKIGIQFLEGSIDGDKYLDLLKDEFPHGGDAKYGKGKWRFMHDGAGAHRLLKVKDWIDDNMPKTLRHPAQSPDLNPIELVWGFMKDFVEKRFPVDKNDLMELILMAWDSLPNNIINQYIDNLSIVMQKIIDNNGGNVDE